MDGRWEWAAPASGEDDLFDGGEGPYPGHAQDDEGWEEGAGGGSRDGSEEAGTAERAGAEGDGMEAEERQWEQEEAFAILQRLSPPVGPIQNLVNSAIHWWSATSTEWSGSGA